MTFKNILTFETLRMHTHALKAHAFGEINLQLLLKYEVDHKKKDYHSSGEGSGVLCQGQSTLLLRATSF